MAADIERLRQYEHDWKRMAEQVKEHIAYSAEVNSDRWRLHAALDTLIREASAVANDHHKPRYTRLDEALTSAREALRLTDMREVR